MNKHLKMVRDFHDAFGFKQANEPTELSLKERIMRASLITEEYSEILRAIAAEDKIKALDGLVDLSYFTLGTLAMMGRDVDTHDHYELKNKPIALETGVQGLNDIVTPVIQSLLDDQIEDYQTELLSELHYSCEALACNWLGADFDKAFEIVQESNMSKLGEDGKPIYDAAGKIRKGPNFKEPDLTQCFDKETDWLI